MYRLQSKPKEKILKAILLINLCLMDDPVAPIWTLHKCQQERQITEISNLHV